MGVAQPANPPEANPPQLPADFQPPRAVPPVMTFTKELITEPQLTLLDRELRADKFTIVFSNAELNNQTKEIVSKWARYQMYRMTLKLNRKRLHEIRADVMRDIGYAARSSNVQKKQVEEFRSFLCSEVTKYGTELLENNFQVRLNAVLVLGNLNLTDPDNRKQLELQAYAGSAIPLMSVLKAKTGGALDEQLEALKVQAAAGLARIGLLSPSADLDVNTKNEIVKTLIAQLQDKKANPWYQKRLLDALASQDLLNDTATNQPIILKTLGEVLVDKQRPYSVRAFAARALGRCFLPASVNTEKLVFQILLLEHEMALDYQKAPNEYYWLDAFEDLYFAFHPVSEGEIDLYGGKRPPGLNRKQLPNANVVRDAYQQLLPIARHVITQDGWLTPDEGFPRAVNEKLSDDLIGNLAKWLQDHQPTDHKLAPNLPELSPAKSVPVANPMPAANATTSG